MGGKSGQTIGYWYKYLLHYGLCRGPVDAFLEWRVGDRTAWAGRQTSSGLLHVDKPELFGGEKREGGIQGYLEVMMGESAQAPNSYLAANLGPEQSGYRGKLTMLWRGGKYGAMNPYPKAGSFKIERILADWPDDAPWYPEKAAILLDSATVPAQLSGWRYLQVAPSDSTDYSGPAFDDSSWSTGAAPFGGWEEGYGESDIAEGAPTAFNPVAEYDARFEPTFASQWEPNTRLWLRRTLTLSSVPSGALRITIYIEDHCELFVNGVSILSTPADHDGGVGQYFEIPDHHLVTGENFIAIRCDDEAQTGAVSVAYVDLILEAVSGVDTYAMNPAHMIYESIIARVEDGGQGEPVGLISDASFRAAADTLHAEGFGLCTTWDGEESAEEFQARICNVIGASLSQSRVDGLYYLDLIRDDYALADLPVISESDVIEFVEEPTNLSEAINQAQVGWFDPTAKEDRVTPPLSSLGGIQSAGGVIAESFTHREIPAESIAMRVAARYLGMKSRPMSRYSLTTNRTPYALRPGKFFRLQMPSEGIADVVCLAGDIDYGELGNGRMKIVAVQDVFGLPSAVFVDPAPGLDTGIDPTPAASTFQRAFEAPYIEIAATLSRADLAALPDDAGYLATAAVRPSGSGLYYAIHTAADSEAYADRGQGDWCPSALVVEAAAPLHTAFTLSGGSDLDLVVVGSWALWGDEIVRVDAIDADANTLTLGRGCADTVPPSPGHAAGTRIYFAGDWAGTDRREYVDGEVVHAKLLTRTSSELFDIDAATANNVTMDQRAFRPYPPAGFTINGAAYPASAFGVITVGGVARDRELQADQLLDTTAAAVGPEVGTTYTIRYYADGVLEHTDTGITSLPSSYTPVGDCTLRVELEAVRDGLASWQAQAHELAYTTAEVDYYVNAAGDSYVDAAGNPYYRG